jgi:hypothetical protein
MHPEFRNARLRAQQGEGCSVASASSQKAVEEIR